MFFIYFFIKTLRVAKITRQKENLLFFKIMNAVQKGRRTEAPFYTVAGQE